MNTVSLIINIILTVIIISAGIFIALDYIKNRNNETISPEDLKELRKKYFRMAMLFIAWMLLERIGRFID